MATVTERPRTANLVESHRKVRDPLHHLRGLIRRYVITEALTTLLICVAVCFWVGLLLDFGFFKLFGIDWVQDLPRWLRAMLLGGGLLVICFLVELRKVLKIRTALTEEVPGATGLLGKVLRNRARLVAVAVPLVVVYLAAWVGLALWLDQGGLAPLAIGLLVFALLAAFAALIVIKRLFYEFRDAALALVLERRYPELLGDRLITAVELHNPAEAEKYGYSAVMVEETIHEAARRVGQLPVREVFDWKRLYVQGGSAIGLTAGVYLLTVLGLLGLAAAREDSSGNVVTDVNRAAGIWFERNVMLDNERWPKRALIQPVGFPDSGEMKVGKGTSSVELRARAVEYAIHDRSVPDRWRAATLRDLRQQGIGGDQLKAWQEYVETEIQQQLLRLFLFGGGNEEEIKGLWKVQARLEPSDSEAGFTLDEVKFGIDRVQTQQQRLENEAQRHILGLFLFGGGSKEEIKDLWKAHAGLDKQIEAPRALLEEVDRRVADSSLSRGLRKLVVPGEVTVKYRGTNKRGEVTLDKIANNEYKGKIEELTESLSFTLRAEDFSSDARRITVVPPPRVITLELADSAPAYLYYLAENDASPLPFLPFDRDQLLLAGKKQASQPIVRSVAGESQPEIRLLSSSDLVLRVITDKPLDPDTLKLDGKGSPSLRGVTPKVIDEHTFEITLHNIHGKLDFRFTFLDTDGVPGVQELLITPGEDESPIIQQFKPEVTRMVGDRYMITPEALIPFSFAVRDDYGLARLVYNYAVTEAPAPDEEKRRYARVAGGIGLALSGPEVPLSALVYNQALPITLQRNEVTIEGHAMVPHFQAGMDALRSQMNEETIARDLQQRVALTPLNKREVLLGPRYRITEKVLKTLRDKGMRNVSLERLYPLEEKGYRTDEQFLGALPKELSDKERRLVLDHARVAQELFSVGSYVFKEVGELDPFLRDHKAPVDDPTMPTKGFDVKLIRRMEGDVEKELKARDLEVQKRYYLQIYLEALDTNVERPGRGKRPSKQYPFVIVSDTELLYEIGKEEERLYDELRKSFDELLKIGEQMSNLRSELPANAAEMQKDDFDRFSVRAEGIEKGLREGLRITVKVAIDYDRIYREMRANRIENTNPKRVNDTYAQIVKPLAGLQESEFHYSQVELTRLRKVLDNSALNEGDRLKNARRAAEQADAEVQRLIKVLREVLAQMRGVVDYNKVKDLIRKISIQEAEAADRIKKFKDKIELELFKGLDAEEPKKP